MINEGKDGCIPTKYDCDPGYIINDSKKACVPEPGSPWPFPFLLLSIFICFLVLGSYLKDKFYTKVLTNLICLIGCLEIFMYVMMVLFSIIMDEWFVLGFCMCGFVGLLLTNIFFAYYYKTSIVKKDYTF